MLFSNYHWLNDCNVNCFGVLRLDKAICILAMVANVLFLFSCHCDMLLGAVLLYKVNINTWKSVKVQWV